MADELEVNIIKFIFFIRVHLRIIFRRFERDEILPELRK